MSDKTEKRLERMLMLGDTDNIEDALKEEGLAYEKCNLGVAQRALKLIKSALALEAMPVTTNKFEVEYDNPLSPAFRNCTVIITSKDSVSFKTHAEREVFSRLIELADDVEIYATKDFPDMSKLTGDIAFGFTVYNVWSD